MGGGMGEMMKEMGAPPPKELYPLLMDWPDLPLEKRIEIKQLAHERMTVGTALLSSGLEKLAESTTNDNYSAMQQATGQMRQGLAQFESGLAAHRALIEGKVTRSVAIEWFKREMNLLPPTGAEARGGPFGLSWFHLFVMVLLVGFAVAMIGMYFFKMQRAVRLLQDLTGGTTPAVATGATLGSSPPALLADGPLAAPSASPAPPGKWSGRLRVSRIFEETPNVKTFRLMNPLDGVLPFVYLPGQFLTVTVAPEGKPVKRSYTIASSPTQHDYVEITVKHEEPGPVSGYLHDRVKAGDLLDVAAPMGSFIFTGRECKCILLIGGGVGITPLMSVLRYLTDRSWPGDIYLLYSCRTPRDVIFREEIDYLQRRHSNLHTLITVSNTEGTDWKGPTSRLTKELIAQSVPDVTSRYVHICGPAPMMEAIKGMLAELGVPKAQVKTEAFGPARGKSVSEPGAAAAEAQVQEIGKKVSLPTVTFARSEKAAPLPPDKFVLDIADEVGVEIDNSCRAGTCGTCRVKLLSGRVTMAVEDGLEPGDKEKSIILACQAKSTGNIIVEA